MLTELEDLQESSEKVWKSVELSFTIETRMQESNELVQREYAFAHSETFDRWFFHEFEEKRTKDSSQVAARNWRRTKHIIWNDVNEVRDIEVPPEVGQKLKKAINADSVTIQIPRGTNCDTVIEYE